MHKDDLSLLKVEKVQIHDKDGNLKAADLPAIIRPALSPEEHAKAILELLRRKSAQADGYRQDLSHINLLIVDRLTSQRLGGGAPGLRGGLPRRRKMASADRRPLR